MFFFSQLPGKPPQGNWCCVKLVYITTALSPCQQVCVCAAFCDTPPTIPFLNAQQPKANPLQKHPGENQTGTVGSRWTRMCSPLLEEESWGKDFVRNHFCPWKTGIKIRRIFGDESWREQKEGLMGFRIFPFSWRVPASEAEGRSWQTGSDDGW